MTNDGMTYDCKQLLNGNVRVGWSIQGTHFRLERSRSVAARHLKPFLFVFLIALGTLSVRAADSPDLARARQVASEGLELARQHLLTL